MMTSIFPAIKDMCKHSVAAVEEQFLNTSIQKSFELFGYDFMITEDFKPVLIEVNTNPCLEFVCPLLTDIISRVVDDSFKIVLDQQFMPSKEMRTKASEEAYQELKSESHSFLPLFPG
ncbi:hypothetical protein EON65_48955 [archaeon]|nr:MAG: hypothetical protein EON65_48955 [archaeon]